MPIPIYKQSGETSLDAIKRFQSARTDLADARLSFAGRLDPLAEGVLVVLVNEENDAGRREAFLKTDKEYEFEVLFGFETDTYDILGLIQEVGGIEVEGVESQLSKFSGTFMQKFPPFSSKHVKGKSMIEWAFLGRMDEIEVPEKEVSVSGIELIEMKNITGAVLLENIVSKIEKVPDTFRTQQIIPNWREVLGARGEEIFTIAKIKIACSTGTYMRTIAHDLGKVLGTFGCTYSIKRIQSGEYAIENCEF